MEKDNSIKEYSNGEVTITWNDSKCTHSGNCVRGLKSVFDTKKDLGLIHKVQHLRKSSNRLKNVQAEPWDITSTMNN